MPSVGVMHLRVLAGREEANYKDLVIASIGLMPVPKRAMFSGCSRRLGYGAYRMLSSARRLNAGRLSCARTSACLLSVAERCFELVQYKENSNEIPVCRGHPGE